MGRVHRFFSRGSTLIIGISDAPEFFPLPWKNVCSLLRVGGGGVARIAPRGGGAKPLEKITIQIYLRAIFANNFGVIDSAAPSEQN